MGKIKQSVFMCVIALMANVLFYINMPPSVHWSVKYGFPLVILLYLLKTFREWKGRV